MMSQIVRGLPNPTPEAVKLWLKRVKRSDLHDVGWIIVNKRFHGLTRSVRPFINQHYDTPEEREAAFDGLTLALMTLAHFEDVKALSRLLNAPPVTEEPAASDRPPESDSS